MEVAGAFRFVYLRARSDRFVKKVPSAAPLFMHARETQTSLQPARVRELCARAKLSARQDKTRQDITNCPMFLPPAGVHLKCALPYLTILRR
jgi:hypothetical protein